MSGHFEAEGHSSHREDHAEYDSKSRGTDDVHSHDRGGNVMHHHSAVDGFDMEEDGMVEEPKTEHKSNIDELKHQIETVFAIIRLDKAKLLTINVDKKKEERSGIDPKNVEEKAKVAAEISAMKIEKLTLKAKIQKDHKTISDLEGKIREILDSVTDVNKRDTDLTHDNEDHDPEQPMFEKADSDTLIEELKIKHKDEIEQLKLNIEPFRVIIHDNENRMALLEVDLRTKQDLRNNMPKEKEDEIAKITEEIQEIHDQNLKLRRETTQQTRKITAFKAKIRAILGIETDQHKRYIHMKKKAVKDINDEEKKKKSEADVVKKKNGTEMNSLML